MIVATVLTALAPGGLAERPLPVGGTRHPVCRLVVAVLGIPLMGYGRWAKVPIWYTFPCWGRP